MEVYVLALQARVLMAVGLGWLGLGIWLGFDPATVAWRAAIGALLAMMAVGWLARRVVEVIEERLAIDMAERQMAVEKAAAEAEAKTAKAGPPPGRPAPVKGRAS